MEAGLPGGSGMGRFPGKPVCSLRRAERQTMPEKISRRALLLAPAYAAGFPGLYSPWCVAAERGGGAAAGDEDGVLRWWPRGSATPPHRVEAARDALFGVALGGDGRMLVACGRVAPRMRAWALPELRPLWEANPHSSWVWCARFSPDSSRLATCGGDAVVRVSEARDGRVVWEARGHVGAVKRVTWAAEGARLLSAGDDGLVRVWDAATGAAMPPLTGHSGWIEAVAAAGNFAVTAGGDRTVRVWDVAAGKQVANLLPGVREPTCAAISPDAALIATGAADRTLRVWERRGMEPGGTALLPGAPLDLAFAEEGAALLVAVRARGVYRVPVTASGALEEGLVLPG